jgi:alpha-amylase
LRRNILALRKLSQKEAFHFFTSIGNPTGTIATSLEDFLKDIKEVNAKSLEFHLEREDFEKWVTNVLKDTKLAREIRYLQNQKLTGEALRNSLYSVVSKRYKELTTNLPKK